MDQKSGDGGQGTGGSRLRNAAAYLLLAAAVAIAPAIAEDPVGKDAEWALALTKYEGTVERLPRLIARGVDRVGDPDGWKLTACREQVDKVDLETGKESTEWEPVGDAMLAFPNPRLVASLAQHEDRRVTLTGLLGTVSGKKTMLLVVAPAVAVEAK